MRAAQLLPRGPQGGVVCPFLEVDTETEGDVGGFDFSGFELGSIALFGAVDFGHRGAFSLGHTQRPVVDTDAEFSVDKYSATSSPPSTAYILCFSVIYSIFIFFGMQR